MRRRGGGVAGSRGRLDHLDGGGATESHMETDQGRKSDMDDGRFSTDDLTRLV